MKKNRDSKDKGKPTHKLQNLFDLKQKQQNKYEQHNNVTYATEEKSANEYKK